MGSVSYMSREQYDRLDRVNWSRLKHLGRSPAHYRHNELNAPKDKPQLRVGRCSHLATYEPERFRLECVKWDNGKRAGKKWTAFQAKHEGREILTADEWDLCGHLSEAVRRDKVAAPYVSKGKAEQTVLWEDAAFQLPCKARLDFIADAGALVDLKTTRDASPEGFGREVWRYRYHTQAAWYSDGYAAATGKRLSYVLVAVEKEAPHVVQVYRVPEAILELGREEYRVLLGRLRDCRQESHWPGYGAGELELQLPRWAVDFADEDDLAGLDLEFAAQE